MLVRESPDGRYVSGCWLAHLTRVDLFFLLLSGDLRAWQAGAHVVLCIRLAPALIRFKFFIRNENILTLCRFGGLLAEPATIAIVFHFLVFLVLSAASVMVSL